jgi:ABC-type multidrug transport system ATPase subunit
MMIGRISDIVILLVHVILVVSPSQHDHRVLWACPCRAAYVYQDDLFFPTLTVREHLKFHAMVRMEKNLADYKKMDKVRGT